MEKCSNKKEIIVYSVNRYFNEDVSINIQNGTVVINAPWFFSNNIPISYRIWNKAFRMPSAMAGTITYLLIKLQNR